MRQISWRDFPSLIMRVVPALSPREWILFAAPLVVSLSALLSIGPIIQPYIFSITDSKAPSIYEAAHESEIVDFPSVGDWLLYATEPLFLAIAFLIAVIALRNRHSRDFAVASSVASFVALTLVDFGIDAFDGNTNLADYLTNIAANLLGAGFLFFVFSGWAFIRQKLLAAGHSTWPIPAAIIATSTILSVVVYIILTWVYQPTTVRIEAELAHPADGFFLPALARDGENPNRSQEKSESPRPGRPFSIFPERTELERVELASTGALSFNLRSEAGQPSYDIELAVFRNCFMGRGERSALAVSDPVRFEGVNTFSLAVDEGLSEISARENIDLSITRSIPTFYWIRQASRDEGGGDVLTEFVTRGDSIRLGFGDNFSALISPHFLTGNTGQTARSPRRLRLRIGERETAISLVPAPQLGQGRLTSCAPVAGDELRTLLATGRGDGVIQFGSDVLGASLLIRLKRRDVPVGIPRPGSFELRNVSGALDGRRPRISLDTQPALGTARTMSMSGNIRRFKVDGRDVDVPVGESVTVIGEIDGRMTSGGHMALLGQGDAVWVARNRLNPTRWERMPSELQVLMLTFLGIAIAAGIRLYRPVWKRIGLNEQFTPF